MSQSDAGDGRVDRRLTLSPLQEFAELTAPPGWRRIDFVSDVHLAPQAPRTFSAFASYLRSTHADAVLILGDLFDAWIGDDSRHCGFELGCADLLRDAAATRAVFFMPGNRDFLVGDDLLAACGVKRLADPTVLAAFGNRAILTHGDSLCLDDQAYQRFRAEVRQPDWQRKFLTRPLAERHHEAQLLRKRSQAARQQADGDSEGSPIDLDRGTLLSWLRESGARMVIHGHTHRPRTEALAPEAVRFVLSDWHFDDGAPPRGEVLSWDGGEISRRRIGIAAPAP